MNKALLKRIQAIFTALLMLCALFAFSLTSLAANEVIKSDINPDLEWIHIKATERCGYESVANFEQLEGPIYKISTDCYSVWYESDDVGFAYRRYTFSYGNSAALNAETTVKSWNPSHMNGSAGLMFRSGLGNGTSEVYMHVRKDMILLLYRPVNGAMSYEAARATMTPTYPIQLKMTLKKTTVEGYYRTSTGGQWIKLGAAPFEHKGIIYSGVASHTHEQGKYETAEFSSFSTEVEAPAGTVYNEDAGGGTTPEESQLPKIPDDIPLDANTDIVMRETFTMGDMLSPETVTNSQGVPSVIRTKPVWKTNLGGVNDNIITNDELTNRYLRLDFTNSWFAAGDGSKWNDYQKWTDYSYEFDLMFNSDILADESKTFGIMMRYTDIVQYGYRHYVVLFRDESPGVAGGGGRKTLSLATYDGKVNGGTPMTAPVVLTTMPFDYLSAEMVDKWLKMKLVAFDNTISLSINGEEKLSYTHNDTKRFKGKGSVGFYTTGISVSLDNIIVRKLFDPMGEDYDNIIGGEYDKPMPEYIREFLDEYKKTWFEQ